jgi:hypothetical protein
MDLDPAFVMVPCTTKLRGTYKTHVQDPKEPVGTDIYSTCRVHAIGHRDVDVKIASTNAPDKAGTWYLITTKDPKLHKNPVWVHEGDGNLTLDY